MAPRVLVLVFVVAALSGGVAGASAAPPVSEPVGPFRIGIELDLGAGTMAVRARCAGDGPCVGRLRVEPVEGAPLRTWRRLAVARRSVRTFRVAVPRRRLIRAMALEPALVVRLWRPRRAAVEAIVNPRVLASCRVGRVVAEHGGTRLVRISGVALLACRPGEERGRIVSEESGGIVSSGTRLHRLAPPYAAYETAGGHKCITTRVAVVDLRTRAVVAALSSGPVRSSAANGCEGSPPLSGIVLRPTGAVAWMVEPGDAGVREVWRTGPAGATPVRVNAAPDLDPRSLRLAGTAVTWRHGAETHALQLP